MPDFGPTSPAASLMDIDATFLPVGQMRQISRVTKLADAVIDAEVDLGPITASASRSEEHTLDGVAAQGASGACREESHAK